MAQKVVIKKEKIDEPKPGPSVAVDETEIEARILEMLAEFPKGISDKMLDTDMPNVDKQVRVNILNRLLSQVYINQIVVNSGIQVYLYLFCM